MLMDLAQRRGKRNRNRQETRQLERPPKHAFEEFALGVLEKDHAPAVAARDRQGTHSPVRMQIVRERKFVLESMQLRRRLLSAQRRAHQNRRVFANGMTPVQGEVASHAQLLEHVSREIRYIDHLALLQGRPDDGRRFI